MVRIILSYILPLVLPTMFYFLWMSWVRKKVAAARAAGEDVEHLELKTPWVRLVLAGVVLMAAGLVVVATVGGEPPTSAYQPPRYVDGKIEPAKSIPR